MENKEHIFSNYIRAGYTILWIQTHEEHRAIRTLANEMNKLDKGNYKFYSWDRVDGIKLREINDNNILLENKLDIKTKTDDPMLALNWISSEEVEENSIFFLLDFHHYIKKDFIQRKIRNIIPICRSTGRVLAVVSCCSSIPDELKKEITVIDFKLPNTNTLRKVCQRAYENARSVEDSIEYPKNDTSLIEAALGMTSDEAENAYSLSIVERKCLDINVINREKATVVKNTGLLNVISVTETLDDIGGLDNLKEWLLVRKNCFTEKAREYGILPPKGALFVGPPGTGKSLVAKVIANVWERPLFSLDVGALLGSLVGESEEKIRRCLSIVDANAPCVLRIDEIEKAFPNNKSGHVHETSQKMLATLLTWMAERTTDVFIAATSNDATKLPPELIRGGRMDAIFWVDFPYDSEREKIISIHLGKINRDPSNFDIKQLVKSTKDFSGSEIEVWINDTLKFSFSKNQEISTEDLVTSAKEVSLTAQLYAEDIKKGREWSEKRRVKKASIEMKAEQVIGKRKLNL